TWVGFSIALMFFYYFILKLNDPQKNILSFLNFSLGMLIAIAFFTFKVHEAKMLFAILLFGLTVTFIAIELGIFKDSKKLMQKTLVLVISAQMQFVTVSFVAFGLLIVSLIMLYRFS